MPADIIFAELQLLRWHNFWWRRVLQFWTALASAPSSSIRSHVLRDSLALAAQGCTRNWAAQVYERLQHHGISIPVTNGVATAVGPWELQLAAACQRQPRSMALDPRSAPSDGAKMCTHHRWFARPQGRTSATYWDAPVTNSKLHRVFRFRMGAHRLPIQTGRHLRLPRSRRVCRLCRTYAMCGKRHVLLECLALADLRSEYAQLIADCSGVMAAGLCGPAIRFLSTDTFLPV